MTLHTDYIFASKTDINEGLTTGEVTKAAIFFTKQHLFVVPFQGVNVWDTSKTKYTNSDDFLNDLNQVIDTMSVTEFENKMIDFLPNDRVYRIDALEKFDIRTGFLGGIRLKKTGEQLQAINVQPKSLRADIKTFYNLQE
jgi:hypothetical protein